MHRGRQMDETLYISTFHPTSDSAVNIQETLYKIECLAKL